MIFLVLNIFHIPLVVCFSIKSYDSLITQLALETLPSYIFIIDIFLSFFKAHYEKGFFFFIIMIIIIYKNKLIN